MNFTICIPSATDGIAFERVRQASWRAAYWGIISEKVFAEREQQFDVRAQSFSEWFAGLDAEGADIEPLTGARRVARIARNECGELIGTATTRQVPGKQLNLQSLYIDPKVFGTGVGEALLQAVIPAHQLVTVEVLAANPRAIAFYNKHGFEQTGRTSTFAGHKTLIMQKNLENPQQKRYN